MNIIITTFNNPFSFFCLAENDSKNITSLQYKVTGNALINKSQVVDASHGQYVAVMWKDKWVRGIVSLKSHFLIWLIDYGIYLRPNEKTVYINLPMEYKKLPTKVFEASIHGVVPLDKVLGDLYIETKERRIFNIIEELELWPVFLEKNKEVYIENLSNYYISRRQHRACLLKPDILNLATINLTTTLLEYNTICAKAVPLEISLECESQQEDGSTIVGFDINKKEKYKLTPDEIEKYSNMYITISGQEYNVLNILLNKIKDLIICERYKDYDKKSVGRGVGSRRLNF
ncbi:uncharacterized protein LOC113516727 isoform X2 [Galleria mellonella]|uniref:Uncharacterized protein LOC113516727 isoform X2 n=1 Tax=Galleria mellonella TaxID=7137 RepID=A0A6J3BVQ4_GALME|nr:uncharacterized protein LOC113516727 isoform X2 [Galleria mellonella]